MRVLLLGGYGLVGLEVAKALLRAGHDVTGLARSAARGRAMLPEAEWIAADIATLTEAEDWRPYLDGMDAVVNAAGVLQSGIRDRVVATQRDGILGLIAACEAQGPRVFVQISAVGASPEATTAFMRSKGEADDALTVSSLDWTIFRPGLVIAPTAYGATSLLRVLASVPIVQPVMSGGAEIQTVDVREVAEAVVRALEGGHAGKSYDLVEEKPHRLTDILRQLRAWQGFAEARAVIAVPSTLGRLGARLADLAGFLGWRPAFRTTALEVLEQNVVGDPAPWKDASGQRLKSLPQTLRDLPATAQERRYARTQLVFPLLLLTLSLFWLLSGFIALLRLEAAAGVLGADVSPGLAFAIVIVGAVVDIAIGFALLVRGLVRTAALAAVAVSLAYLLGGSLLTPWLWADPLGPLVKVLPGIALAMAVWAMAGER